MAFLATLIFLIAGFACFILAVIVGNHRIIEDDLADQESRPWPSEPAPRPLDKSELPPARVSEAH